MPLPPGVVTALPPALGEGRRVASLHPLPDGRLVVLDTEGIAWRGPPGGPFTRQAEQVEAVVVTPVGPWWLRSGTLFDGDDEVPLRGPWIAPLGDVAVSPDGTRLAVRADDVTASRVLVGPLRAGAVLEPVGEVPAAWTDLTWGHDDQIRGRQGGRHERVVPDAGTVTVPTSAVAPRSTVDGWVRWTADALALEDGRVLHPGVPAPSLVASVDGRFLGWVDRHGLHVVAVDGSTAWQWPPPPEGAWGPLALAAGDAPTPLVTLVQPNGDAIVPILSGGSPIAPVSPTDGGASIRR